MQWSVAEGWDYFKDSNGAYVYLLRIDSNTELDEADVIADDGKITVSESITKSEMQTLTSVSIKLRAIAVQSGGLKIPKPHGTRFRQRKECKRMRKKQQQQQIYFSVTMLFQYSFQ